MNKWPEWFRFLTPILITIAIFMLNDISTKTKEELCTIKSMVQSLDDKMFKHLTNDEIHAPKSIVVTRAEFLIYQEMRKSQMEFIQKDMNTRITNLTSSIDKAILMLNDRKK